MQNFEFILLFKKLINLFIFGCVGSSFLCEGFSLVAASGGRSSLRCAGLSPSRPLLLRSTGTRRAGSIIVAHGPSCSAACGIFPDQSSNPCALHWQADSQPLCHQGSHKFILICLCLLSISQRSLSLSSRFKTPSLIQYVLSPSFSPPHLFFGGGRGCGGGGGGELVVGTKTGGASL